MRKLKADQKLSVSDLRRHFSFDPKTGIIQRIKETRKAGVRTVGKRVGWLEKRGYIRLRFRQHKILAHTLIWTLHYGKFPKDALDHINGVRHDNRIKNLREDDGLINAGNTWKHRSGHLLGTTFDKERKLWVSQISRDEEYIFLGRFKTKEQAHKAYKEKLKQIESGK